jgi:hypothetical protein
MFSSNHSLERLCSICNERTLPEDLISLLRIHKRELQQPSCVHKDHQDSFERNHYLHTDLQRHGVTRPSNSHFLDRSRWWKRCLFAFIRSMSLLTKQKARGNRGKWKVEFRRMIFFVAPLFCQARVGPSHSSVYGYRTP